MSVEVSPSLTTGGSTNEAPSPGPTPPHHRRKPFSSLMKRLANLKTSSHHHGHSSSPSNGYPNSKSAGHGQGNGYPNSLRKSSSASNTSSSRKHRSNSQPSLLSNTCPIPSHKSIAETGSGRHQHSPSTSSGDSCKGGLPKPSNTTVTTTTTTSLHSPSGWSSPAQSVHSLTTTLTTIQSTAPHFSYNPHASHHHNPNGPPVLFNNPLPSPSLLHPSAAPSGPTGNQVYYSTATANGLLTDNASIITLASSSQRRRRRSFDTDASIRALAPASLWGGSRESLPLSVLSSNFDNRMPGERTSLYGRLGGDTSSIRGMHSPGATSTAQATGESYFFPPTASRECGGIQGSAPGNRESMGNGPGGLYGGRSRRSSGWGEVYPNDEGGDDDDARSTRTASIRSGRTGPVEVDSNTMDSAAVGPAAGESKHTEEKKPASAPGAVSALNQNMASSPNPEKGKENKKESPRLPPPTSSAMN